MNASHFSRLLALLLPVLCMPGQAQTLDPRWHGQWQSADARWSISGQGFQQGALQCRWAASKPPAAKACTAHPDLPVHKDQLVRLLDDAEVAHQAKKLPAAERDRLRRDLARHRQALAPLAAREFATVQLSRADAPGGCMDYFLLDRDSLIGVHDCSDQPGAASVTRFTRTP